jgi:hypothetical protein
MLYSVLQSAPVLPRRICACAWSTLSDTICRCFNPDACPGGTYQAQQAGTEHQDSNTRLCAPGYTGNLCAVCAPKYGTVKAFTCKPCMQPAATIALYTLAALVMLVVVSELAFVRTYVLRHGGSWPSVAQVVLQVFMVAGWPTTAGVFGFFHRWFLCIVQRVEGMPCAAPPGWSMLTAARPVVPSVHIDGGSCCATSGKSEAIFSLVVSAACAACRSVCCLPWHWLILAPWHLTRQGR